jgi:AcrR family transcriptional regulator
MTEQPDVELPRGLALAWGLVAAPQRGPKREMSVESIVEAALAIADESGLGAVSMAAVAARFDVTPMALYRYVSAKDDLVLLMYEAGIGLPPVIEPGTPWRDGLDQWGRAQYASMAAHPWLLDVPITGAPLTPHGLAWADAGVAALETTGLSGGERLSAILAMSGQIRWIATLTRRHGGSSALELDQSALLRQLVQADAYPAFHHALFGDGAGSDPAEFGMAVVLEGIAALADGKALPVAPLAPLPEAVFKNKKVREKAQRRREREREWQQALRDEQIAIREALKGL